MKLKVPRAMLCAAVAILIIAPAHAVRGAITDFTTWTQVQDPAHPNFTSTANATQATLFAANGAVPAGTDIGYQSANGATPGTSSAGYAFDSSSSFSIAIDYSASFSNTPTGYLGIGFGVGKDGDGKDSAGAALLFNSGSPTIFFGAAARINDVNQSPQVIFVGGSASGSMFASYDAATGNVTLGASGTAGAGSPTNTTTFTGIENSWAAGDLLASFFLRSDNSLGSAWQSGNAQVVFSNFRILSGQAIAVPEPGALTLLMVAGLLVQRRRMGRSLA